MYKKTLFLTLIILFIIPSLINATTLTVKGKSGYNLTINIVNPLNNESISPLLTADIGSSGQVNLEFSVSSTKASIITMARVNGKIVKKKEIYNVNVQSVSPIIIDLIDPPVPKPVHIVQNTTPPTPTPTPAPIVNSTPAPTSTQAPETKENKTNLLTGMATSFESINLSSTTKIIIFASIGGIILIVVIVFVVMFLIKRKRKSKSGEDSKRFKVTKFSYLTKESEPEDIEEAEKRLKVAKEEIDRINQILNKRRAIKEAEQKLEEERRALEKLKKGFR